MTCSLGISATKLEAWSKGFVATPWSEGILPYELPAWGSRRPFGTDSPPRALRARPRRRLSIAGLMPVGATSEQERWRRGAFQGVGPGYAPGVQI